MTGAISPLDAAPEIRHETGERRPRGAAIDGETAGRGDARGPGAEERDDGRPGERVHTLQVEINRALYLEEENLVRHEGFDALQADLGVLFETLARAVNDGRL